MNLTPTPLGPKKVKNYPRFWSQLKVGIEGNIKKKSLSALCVDPKTDF